MKDKTEFDKLAIYLKEHGIPFERYDDIDRHHIWVPAFEWDCEWDVLCEDGLLDLYGNITRNTDDESEGYLTTQDVIERIEENRPIAQWILDPDGVDWNIPAWRCSRCGCRNDNIGIYGDDRPQNPFRWSGSKYCPECGAKMIWYRKGYEKVNDKSTK